LLNHVGGVRGLDNSHELANCSTTMAEDINVTVANLLDFDRSIMMRLGMREERTHAIVLSFNTLSFSLFYNTGPRSQQAQPQRINQNRWPPTEPVKAF
jgi:hypothetical protein